MDLSVVCPPHGVAVVDADVLALLDVHCCADHNPDVGGSRVIILKNRKEFF